MTAPMKIQKTFDCVEFKRRTQLEVYAQVQGMTHEQERSYFQAHAERGPLGDWWKHLKAAKPITSDALRR